MDRHNGNWGFLLNKRLQTSEIALIYDCGSSLYTQADEGIMKNTLIDSGQTNLRVFEIPKSVLRIGNVKINYYDFISSLAYPGCNRALKRVVPRIDMKAIDNIVDNTPFTSPLQRAFYKHMLHARKTAILNSAYNIITR